MQVPFEGEVELPLKGHLAFKGAAMVQRNVTRAMIQKHVEHVGKA